MKGTLIVDSIVKHTAKELVLSYAAIIIPFWLGDLFQRLASYVVFIRQFR
jgi:hypothetical protein